jgi:acetyltransferase-like isoleucine patch superfamily enzyme
MIRQIYDTPWKAINGLKSLLIWPWVRLYFLINVIRWEENWQFYGTPILLKHRQSVMCFGKNLQLRSSVRSNPLGPNHAVILCTLQAGAKLEVGENFAMTGGVLCAAESIKIGNNVSVGANCTIVDTDFHPIHPGMRRQHPQQGKSAPVIIGDNVFIGMNSLVLKGVTIGENSVIGAGSVVSTSIPDNTIAVGNPARAIHEIS